MKNQNIIDCYKLDIIKDIPLELDLITQNRDQLLFENQKLKKILLALSVGLGGIIAYKIINYYGKKKRDKKQIS